MHGLKRPTRAPNGLSKESAAWWREAVRQFDFRTAGELAVLTEAARSLDRIAECRDVIQREGLFINGARGLVQHPAARLEQQHRSLVLQACRQLGISSPAEG